jgi:hypothetical protein
MSAKTAEERANATSSATVTIRLAGGKSVKSTKVWNISLGGVFVQMSEPLAFGAEGDFEFSLGPGVGTVRCRGFVIWSTRESPEKGNGEQGVGVRLTDLGVAEMRSIADVVGRNL